VTPVLASVSEESNNVGPTGFLCMARIASICGGATWLLELLALGPIELDQYKITFWASDV
jgi:hypothetical protein